MTSPDWQDDPGRWHNRVPALATVGLLRGVDGTGALMLRHPLDPRHHGIDGVLPAALVFPSADTAPVGACTELLTGETLCVTTSLAAEILVDDLGREPVEVVSSGVVTGQVGDTYLAQGTCRTADGRVVAALTLWAQKVEIPVFTAEDAPPSAALTQAAGLLDLLGVRSTDRTPDGSVVHADIVPALMNAAGHTHGLVPPLLVELAVRAALPDAAPRLRGVRVDYGRPLPAGAVTATATVGRRGRTGARVLVVCAGEDGRPCVEAVVTCAL